MVRMLAPSGFGLKLIVALQANGVILLTRLLPLGTYGPMGIVTVDAAQLGVAAAAHGVGVFDRVPGGHPGGKTRPPAGVAAAAGPVDVVVTAALQWLSLRDSPAAAVPPQREELSRKASPSHHFRLASGQRARVARFCQKSF